LGARYRVVEEGLSGRTTVLDDPLVPHRNGRDYLVPCLQSHRPLDIVVIFLGTNDLADRYSLPPMDIARAAASLAVLVSASEVGPSGASPTPLLVCPPRLGDMTSRADTMSGALARAAELPRCFRIAAEEAGVSLVDLSATLTYSDVDGVHLDASGHREVSKAIAGWIGASTRDSPRKVERP
jgi:lysophospholipase L1-like esterase